MKLLIDGDLLVFQNKMGQLVEINLAEGKINSVHPESVEALDMIKHKETSRIVSYGLNDELDSKQAAEYLGVERWFVSQMDRDEHLESSTPEKKKCRLYKRSELDRFKSECERFILAHSKRDRRERS